MADPKIKLKRSSVAGKIPTEDQVPLGELALNTNDGYLYASKNVGVGTTVIAINPFRVGTGTDSYNTYFTAGNVGIGSTQPLVALDVAGVIREELHSPTMPVGLNDDIGASWTKIEMGSGLKSIYSLVYCGNGIVLAGAGSSTDYGDVYRSTDFGLTWSKIEMGSGLEAILSLVYCGNGIVLAGSGFSTNDGDVYRSTDFGLTWSKIEMGAGLESIWSLVYCGNGIVLAGSGSDTGDGDIYRSTDFGLTWSKIEMGAGLERIFSLVYCGNGIVLAGSGDGTGDGDVYRSTDFGLTWTKIEMGAGLEAIRSLSYCGNGIVLAGGGNYSGNGDIYRSTDFGLTWTKIVIYSFLEEIGSLVYCGNGIILGGSGASTTEGDIYKSTDFGLTWTKIDLDNALERIWSLVYCGNGIVLAGSGDSSGDGDVYRSDVGFSQASTIQGVYHEHLTGNIGIGSTQPTAKLDVVGDSKFTGVITATSFTGSGINLTGIVTSIVAGTNVTISGSTGEVTINASGGGGGGESYWESTEVGINTLSNVGVGTTNPTSKLSVVGDGDFTGVVTATSFIKSGGTSSQFLKADGSTDSSTYLTTYTETDTLNSVVSRGNSTSDNITVGAIKATVGISTFEYGLQIPDNNSIFLGSGQDFSLYHDGSNSRISNNTGNLTISNNFGAGKNISISNNFIGTLEPMGVFNCDSSVDLYYNNSKKFATAGTGITVTGNIDTDGLYSSGNISVSGISTLTNRLDILSDDSTSARVDLYCEVGNAHYTRIQAAPHSEYSGNATIILPTISGDILIGDTDSSITQNLNTTGVITATSFIKSGGTSSEFLKADGSSDSSTYLTTTGSGINLTGIVTSIVAGTNVTISGSTGEVTINASGGGGGGESYWISTAAGIHTLSNVGIGSTIPTSKLDVVGDSKFTGVITATSFIKSGGTSDQFLKADGSTDSSTYLTTTGSGINLTGIVTSIVAGSGIIVDQSTGEVTINASGGGGGSGVDVYDGSYVGFATGIDFGDNLTVSPVSAGVVTVTASGGGGSGSIGISSSGTLIGVGVTLFDFIGIGITASVNGTTGSITIPTTTRTTTRATATNGQTTFSGLSYNVGYVDVYLNGSKLDSTEYTATDETSVILSTGASTDDVLEFVAFDGLSIVDLNGLSDIVQDTTPQLGGNLDINGRDVTGTGNINITGDINITGISTASSFSGNVSGDVNAGIVTASNTFIGGGVDLSGILIESANITAGKLSDNLNIDLTNGMVHLFTTTETTTSTPNIRFDASNSLDSKMSTGDSVSVVIITTAAAAGYSAQLTIDGGAVTESWLGGAAPTTGGASGYDVYTYNIIKTGSATFIVLANLTNFA